MMRLFTPLISAILTIAMPAQALAANTCWTSDQVRAAEIREFYTFIMVGALRCRTDDATIMNKFVTFANRKTSALNEANLKLRGHYVTAVGTARAQNAVDVYATKVANRYGAGVAGIGCADLSSIVDAANAEASTTAALSAMARRSATQPLLDDARCDAIAAPLRFVQLAPPRRSPPPPVAAYSGLSRFEQVAYVRHMPARAEPTPRHFAPLAPPLSLPQPYPAIEPDHVPRLEVAPGFMNVPVTTPDTPTGRP